MWDLSSRLDAHAHLIRKDARDCQRFGWRDRDGREAGGGVARWVGAKADKANQLVCLAWRNAKRPLRDCLSRDMFPFMMYPSSHIIELLSTTAMTPYSSIERMTRPMKAQNPPLWMHRGDPKVRLEYLASIVAAFAAPLPVESMSAIKTARALILRSYFDSPAPSDEVDAVCSDDDALFDRGGPNHPTLIEYNSVIIRELAEMDKLERHKRVQRMQQGNWMMSISLAPAFAVVSWQMLGPAGLVRRALEWKPLQADLPLPQPKRRQGIQRLTWIPPEIFLTLADIYADALADEAGASVVLGAAPASAAPGDENQVSPAREMTPSRAYDMPMDQNDFNQPISFAVEAVAPTGLP